MGKHDEMVMEVGREAPDAPRGMLVRKGKGMVCYDVRIGMMYFRSQWQRCGKKNCWCSDKVARDLKRKLGHGPYWYRMIKNGERWIKKHLGRELVVDGRHVVILNNEQKMIAGTEFRAPDDSEGWNAYFCGLEREP